MKNIRIIINENHELFEIPFIFSKKEIQKYLGTLLENDIRFEYNGEYLMVMDSISSEQKIIQDIVRKEYNPSKIAKDIRETMNIEAKVNHDKNIDVIDTDFKTIGKICFAFDLELRHAYNGLSGTDFELNVKG